MKYIPAFLDITKFANFRRKNADVSRTQGVHHMIHKFFESSLGKVNCAKFHYCRICVTGFRVGTFLPSRFHLSAAPKRPILNRVKKLQIFSYLAFYIDQSNPSKPAIKCCSGKILFFSHHTIHISVISIVKKKVVIRDCY